MATKYLDLDALETTTVTLRLNGKEHSYKEMTINDFIWAQKQSEITDAALTDEEKFESMTGIVRRSFPTITREDLGELTIQKLGKLVEFILSLSKPEEAVAKVTGDEGKEVVPATMNPS